MDNTPVTKQVMSMDHYGMLTLRRIMVMCITAKVQQHQRAIHWIAL